MRRASDHVQVDDLFGFGGEVWEERFLDAGRSGGEQLVGHAFAQQGSEGGQKREHADDGMTAAPKTLRFLGVLEI